jgi:hypothetical protein
MAICVDRLRRVKQSKNWPWPKACHLFDDENDVEALHRFAGLLKLKPEWFQNRVGFPHYDITERRRMLAVAMGAKEVDRPERREVNHGT